MLSLVIFGIVLGWGAAIPIGPINLEIIRRHLTYGGRYGVCFGLGACSADLTYLILLSFGVLIYLSNPATLKILGIGGSIILMYFALQALRLTPSSSKASDTLTKKPNSLLQNSLAGYMLTLLNPYTVIFWASISAQVALLAANHSMGLIYAGLGLIIGTVSWVLSLNVLLHYNKHRLGKHSQLWLNRIGGVLLMAFAGYGFYRALFVL